MTTEEICKIIVTHMVKGLMVHEELSNYYDFLNLKGYRQCHEYHFIEQSYGYRKFCTYIINHFNKLTPKEINSVNVISSSWYNYTKNDVDINTKKKAIKEGIDKWINWQKETKELYQNLYQELLANNQIAFALFLSQYIQDVDDELANAQEHYLILQGVDYDMTYISDEQDEKYKYYTHKIEKIY